jgi:iron complex outermembrane receptor protein
MTIRPSCRLALALAGAPLAFAQTAPEPVQAPEMVVSATFIPSDAAGTTRVDLEPEVGPGAGAWELLGRAVANFHVADSGAGGYGGLFALRGLANTPYFSEPAVTVYFADIPLPSSFTYPTGLFGFNSVAVYRGPQGTEFGRATDGGVVVFSPDSAGSPSGGELLAGAGSYDERQVAGEVRVAPSPGTDAVASADYEARNGYITNQRLGIHVDDVETENLFARVRMRPAAGDELSLEVLDTRSRDGAQPLVPLDGPLFAVNRAQEGVTDLDSLGVALKAAVALPAAASLTSVTSYTDWRMNPYESFLVLPPPLDNQILQDQKSWNEELRFRSDPLASFRLEIGAWLSKGTTDNSVDRAIPNLYPIEVSSFEQGNESGALFGQAVWAPDKAWKITAGLRAESDEKNFVRREEVPTPGLVYIGDGRYDGILPRLAANWTIDPDTHAEAAVDLGLRPGGFASYTDKPDLIAFASERTTALSAGWDTAFAQHTVDVAVRAFYDDIDNLQIERSFSQTDYFVATAPRAHSVGSEIEGRWRPAPSWTVALTAGWAYVRLDSFHDPISGADESGNEAPNAPQYNADLDVAYRPGHGFFAGAQLAAVGRTFYDEVETPKYTQGAYSLLGLRAGYETARWTLMIYGENLANTGYYELIIPGVNSGNPGAPRTFGVRASIKF